MNNNMFLVTTLPPNGNPTEQCVQVIDAIRQEWLLRV
jgi:hypothetical protein